MAGGQAGEELKSLAAEVKKMSGGTELPPYVLAAFEPARWDCAFSPWPAPALHLGEEGFTGGGGRTLELIRQVVLPEAEEKLGLPALPANRTIIGYSLSGLFALWTMYESSLFSACACCSGSLWYDGWMDYMREHRPHIDSHIYLSLGRKEEKTRDSRRCVIGCNTREAAELLAAEPNVTCTELVWHDGGHGHEVLRRLAAAVLWVLR
jgi:predicted alpha/beta superfamily hydrolase